MTKVLFVPLQRAMKARYNLFIYFFRQWKLTESLTDEALCNIGGANIPGILR